MGNFGDKNSNIIEVSGLPKIIGVIASIDPLSYGVDGLRSTLSGITHFGLAIDAVFLSLGVVILLSIGSFLFSKIEV